MIYRLTAKIGTDRFRYDGPTIDLCVRALSEYAAARVPDHAELTVIGFSGEYIAEADVTDEVSAYSVIDRIAGCEAAIDDAREVSA